jgi:hypothetical protein
MDYLPEVEHMFKSFQFQNTKPTRTRRRLDYVF